MVAITFYNANATNSIDYLLVSKSLFNHLMEFQWGMFNCFADNFQSVLK